MEQLRRDTLLAHPALDFDKLLPVKRKANQLGLPQDWQGNSNIPPVGYDNEIAVPSPVRSDGKLTTLYKPEGGKFVGDLELHWDAERILAVQFALTAPVVPEPLPKRTGQAVECPVSPFNESEARERQVAQASSLPAGRMSALQLRQTERKIDPGNGVTLELVYILAGEFVMGAPNGEEDELPLTRVRNDRDDRDDGANKVVRGGSWFDRSHRSRASFRLSYPSWQGVYNVGFRVVCEVK